MISPDELIHSVDDNISIYMVISIEIEVFGVFDFIYESQWTPS